MLNVYEFSGKHPLFWLSRFKQVKVFLMNKSFTTFSGSTASRALLFPMESVYESYVAQQMKKVMSPEGTIIRTSIFLWIVFCVRQ